MQLNTIENKTILLNSDQLTSEIDENIYENLVKDMTDPTKINIFANGFVSPDTIEIMYTKNIEYKQSALSGHLSVDLTVKSFHNVLPIGYTGYFTVTNICPYFIECRDHYFVIRIPYDIQYDKTLDIKKLLISINGSESVKEIPKLLSKDEIKKIAIGDTIEILCLNLNYNTEESIVYATAVCTSKSNVFIKRIYHEETLEIENIEIQKSTKGKEVDILKSHFPTYLTFNETTYPVQKELTKSQSDLFKAMGFKANASLKMDYQLCLFDEITKDTITKVKKHSSALYTCKNIENEDIQLLQKNYMVVLIVNNYVLCLVKI